MDIWEVDHYYMKLKQLPNEYSLPSDASKRNDSNALISGNELLAQTKKEELEDLQRHDRRLRENA